MVKRFVYAPSVEAYVHAMPASALDTSYGKIYNISPDIVSCSVNRNVNACSTARFELANKNAKYDGLFKPMDKITIFMKRTDKKVQVFSGYITSVPVYSAGSTVSISCSCTLNRLQKLFWDANLQASVEQYFNPALGIGTIGGTQPDGGMALAITNILTNVAGWDSSKIFIRNIPSRIITYATDMFTLLNESDVQYKEAMRKIFNQEGTDASATPGVGEQEVSVPSRLSATQKENMAKLLPHIQLRANKKNVPAWAICAMIEKESSWESKKSSDGAYGLCQIQLTGCEGRKERTTSPWYKEGRGNYFDGDNWKDDEWSIDIGSMILANSFNLAWEDAKSSCREQFSLAHAKVAYYAYNCGHASDYPSIGQAERNAEKYQEKCKAYIPNLPKDDDGIVDLFQAVTGTLIGGTIGFAVGGPIGAVVGGATGLGATTGTNKALEKEDRNSVALGSGKNILKIASDEIGTKETRLNEVKYNEWFYSRKVNGKDYFWCAVFVSWCAMKAGVLGSAGNVRKSASVWEIYNRFNKLQKAQKVQDKYFSTSNPRPGDIFIMPRAGVTKHAFVSKPSQGHTGYVNSVDKEKGTFTTIEGNSADAVISQTRKISDMVGFCRPQYPVKPTTIDKLGKNVGVADVQGDGGDVAPELKFYNSDIWWQNANNFEIGSEISELYQGARALANDVSVYGKISELCSSSFRDFASAPDGSFIAWYPDKFGRAWRDKGDDLIITSENAVPTFNIRNIEVTKATINFKDDNVITHSYCYGGFIDDLGVTEDIAYAKTNGVVTIDNENLVNLQGATANPNKKSTELTNNDTSKLLRLILNIEKVVDGKVVVDVNGNPVCAPGYTPNDIYYRYGARPLKVSPGSNTSNMSFMPYLMALQGMMQSWSECWDCSVETTFLPEVLPGMRVNFVDEDIQMYVSSVSHSCSYTSGFSTNLTLECPTSKSRKGMLTQ